MIKGTIVFLVVLGMGLFWCCGAQFSKQEATQIRVINGTKRVFTNVSMFSMQFGDLMPGDSSEFKPLRYDPLRHDPLIYCMNDSVNYGRYLRIPEKDIGKYTYRIDSVKNKILYISSRKGL